MVKVECEKCEFERIANTKLELEEEMGYLDGILPNSQCTSKCPYCGQENTLIIDCKKFKTVRALGYPLLGGKQPRIDTNAIYYLVGYAKACENRPIIERVDGEKFDGENHWIVDNHDLIEV